MEIPGFVAFFIRDSVYGRSPFLKAVLLFWIVPFFPDSGEPQGAFRKVFMEKKSVAPFPEGSVGQRG
jgi:hypothetical protein